MATPSDPSNQEAVVRRRNNGPPIKFLLPLIYAPVLPLIRLSLRHKPVLRDRLFTAVLAGAFAHGFYLVLFGPMKYLCFRLFDHLLRPTKFVSRSSPESFGS
ncbi:hypothetical protein HKD37_05G011939 [Glycine soja]|nr:hypothetical protein JHK87_011341 [Glycine soja]KAG5039304.1 hypothetical protein JHK85_011780 [Glycine max]KAG5056457.1 hypothetical protein JHK86_011453 [Glycine max]KHN27402.1 hypothetical protein glysoja_022111 [Glycine soja]